VLRRLAAVLVTVVALAVLATVATLFWLVQHDGWLVQSVATGSMEPTIPTGSVLLTRPVAVEDLDVGDIVVFVAPVGSVVAVGPDGQARDLGAMYITHRITAIAEGPDGSLVFRTRGDANPDDDPWPVHADTVRTQYVGHVPRVGEVIARPDLRRWVYAVVAGVGVLVIVAESRSIVRQLRTRDDEPATTRGATYYPAPPPEQARAMTRRELHRPDAPPRADGPPGYFPPVNDTVAAGSSATTSEPNASM
jgi:signal peptidase